MIPKETIDYEHYESSCRAWGLKAPSLASTAELFGLSFRPGAEC